MVEGVVVSSASGAPVPGVSVSLVRTAGGKTTHRIHTGSQGEFRIEDAAAGEYKVELDKDGFSGPPWDHPSLKPFRVPGLTGTVRLRLEMTPMSTLSGRVLDGEGRPIAGASVELIRRFGSTTYFTGTRAEGEYRFDHLQPGQYLLRAWARRRRLLEPADSRESPAGPEAAPGEPRRAWAPTYLPGVANRDQAEIITARPGLDRAAADIRLMAVPVYEVSGTILDEQGRPAPKASLMLFSADDRSGFPEISTSAEEDGTFQFAGIREGEWFLRTGHRRGTAMLKGYLRFNISRQGEEGLELRLSPPFALTGFVEREEARDGEGKRKATGVTLIPAGPAGERIPTVFHDQAGNFTFPRVYAGRYTVFPLGFVPDYYLASVMLGDREVTGRPVDLAEGAPPLRVVYRPNAGRARGKVEKGAGATVVIAPQDEAFLDTQFTRTAKCGPEGNYEVSSLRPGEYYAFAFDRIDPDALEDVGFFRTLAPLAAKVRIREGEAASLDLRVTPWPEP